MVYHSMKYSRVIPALYFFRPWRPHSPTWSSPSGPAICIVSLISSVDFSTGIRHDANATSCAESREEKVPFSSSSEANSSSAVSISQAARPLSVTTPGPGRHHGVNIKTCQRGPRPTIKTT
ncbi:hypothetical protein Vafri_14980 [Volvox africanus]|uniref:Uncharacterized protein n=1 Tax=Volvox africanus TaxID=51714 RepID=A0A8J4F855_9CHLO|nr:hypothetical protein Vafri_14980 [Volvox africanus]